MTELRIRSTATWVALPGTPVTITALSGSDTPPHAADGELIGPIERHLDSTGSLVVDLPSSDSLIPEGAIYRVVCGGHVWAVQLPAGEPSGGGPWFVGDPLIAAPPGTAPALFVPGPPGVFASVEVETLDYTEDATAGITGDPGDQTLHLGIPGGAPGLPVARTLDPVDSVLAADGRFPQLLATAPRSVLALPANAVQAVPVGTTVGVVCVGEVVVHAGVGASLTGGHLMGWAEPGGVVTAVKSATDTWTVVGVTWPEVLASEAFATDGSMHGDTLANDAGGGDLTATWAISGAAAGWASTGGQLHTPTGNPTVERRLTVPLAADVDRGVIVGCIIAVKPDTRTTGPLVHAPSLAAADGWSVAAASTGTLSIINVVAGTQTSLVSGIAYTAGDRVAIAAIPTYDTDGDLVGTRVLAVRQGAVVASVDSTDHPALGHVGMRSTGQNGPGRYDDWTCEVLR